MGERSLEARIGSTAESLVDISEPSMCPWHHFNSTGQDLEREISRIHYGLLAGLNHGRFQDWQPMQALEVHDHDTAIGRCRYKPRNSSANGLGAISIAKHEPGIIRSLRDVLFKPKSPRHAPCFPVKGLQMFISVTLDNLKICDLRDGRSRHLENSAATSDQSIS